MRTLRKNSRRPRVEQLEDRCVPGSVLDLLGDPLLAPLGLAMGGLVSPQHNTILASPVAAGVQVPFNGSLEGLDIVTAVNPPFVSVQQTATGNATQLGLFTYTARDTVD